MKRPRGAPSPQGARATRFARTRGDRLGLGRALLFVCVLSATASADVTEKSRVEVQPPGKPYKQVSIDNSLGNVRIEGHDGKNVIIETIKRAGTDEAIERLRISLVPDPDGTVRITTHADPSPESKPVARSAVSIDVVIRAPRGARFDATVGSGKLEAKNMDAGGELDSASGAITVDNVQGELYTHSVSGSITINKAFGDVDAATVSSDVALDSISGQKLVASANDGKIAGRRVRSRDIELTTMTGKITLEAEALPRGRIVVSSMRGDVEVKLRRQAQTAMVVRGRGTKVDLGSTPVTVLGKWQEAKLGSGGEATVVELRSNHGFVQFLQLAVIQ
ncbi:MAG TPA: DUF4097 family beta strand repeat-containing protein [Kofleriaceae bacterium]